VTASFTFGRVCGDAPVASARFDAPAHWILVVRITGELDTVTVPQLRPVLNEHLGWSRPCRLVLDLTGVTLLTSAALTLLLELQHSTRHHDEHLILVGAGHRAVHRPLRLTGLLPLFDTRPTLDQALTGSGTSPFCPWPRIRTPATRQDEHHR